MKLVSTLCALLFVSAPALAEGDPQAGRAKSSACAGCHEIQGFKSVFPEVYPIPRIMNQNPEYLEYALKQYQSGEREHPSMASVGMTLSDEDISDLAAYYGSYDAHQ